MADLNAAHLATDDFVRKQKIVYELLSHVKQPKTVNCDLYTEGKEWDIQANNKSYDSEIVVTEFLNRFNNGMLPRGEIFSIFYPHILEETVALFRLFRSAVDFDTFWKTAAWARIFINEEQFIYAFSVAVVHRPDTKYIRLPTLDEIKPHFFFDSKIITQAHQIKMQHVAYDSSSQKPYFIWKDHQHWYTRPQGDHEHKLNYFTEDVGLNGYYYILNLEFPFWMSSDEFRLPKGYRGEQYYHAMKLLLTRYNLERLSNGLNEIEDIEWNKPITMGYYPFMAYENGVHFPQRFHDSVVPSNKWKYVEEMRNAEARILEVIDSGFYTDTDGKRENIYTVAGGFDVFGSMIEGNVDSIHRGFYGSIDHIGRNILGFNPDSLSKYKICPSALQHFGTSLRDPAFYRLMKRIVGYFDRYKSRMEQYTPEKLGFSSGLKIESVYFDKLETFFDYSESIINNAVMVRDNDDADSFVLKARQYRLNHKPFTYTIYIDSKIETPAMIRMFIGPKYDVFHEELDIAENYQKYYEFDMWRVNLKIGRNEIKRTSHETHFTLPDQEGKDGFYKKVKMAVERREPLAYSENVYGFPQRLLLPKGTENGITYKIFTHVIPCTKEQFVETDSPLWGKAFVDGNPMGYPLDRPMKKDYFNFENMYLKDVMICHKETREGNLTF